MPHRERKDEEKVKTGWTFFRWAGCTFYTEREEKRGGRGHTDILFLIFFAKKVQDMAEIYIFKGGLGEGVWIG
mgnify:CR=1 FL=1